MDEQIMELNSALIGFNFSLSYLIASFIFGVAGLYYFRVGKKRLNYRVIGIGVALMVYPLFLQNSWLVWGVGAFLCAGAYYYLDESR